MADKEKENNKDAVMTFTSSPDIDGSFVSLKQVYKYKDGPWWKRILGEYEPGENFQRTIIHRYDQPNDTIITTPAGKAHSLYFGPNVKQRRTANFDDINKLFTDTFNSAGYEMEWGSNPKPRHKNGGNLNYLKLYK